MDPKTNENPDPQAEGVPDLPVTPEQANAVKGGHNMEKPTPKGTHLPEVTIEVW